GRPVIFARMPFSTAAFFASEGESLLSVGQRGAHVWPIIRDAEGTIVRLGPAEMLACEEEPLSFPFTHAMATRGNTNWVTLRSQRRAFYLDLKSPRNVRAIPGQ